MKIIIYDTKSGSKTPLEPITPGHIKLYVCGITAYDYCHIGHARSALVFDMIVRYLRYRGFTVTFVRNFTDIDDKIIMRAQEQNTTPEELAERFIGKFQEDMARLGVVTADHEPRATEHIPAIINIIEELIGKGLAYQSGNDVYFAVDKFPNYGALSGRSLDDMLAGARISVNENKTNPMDFALWKGSKPGEPTWESPWGPGRPGWHIECSAMSRELLGNTFDIHGGGKDLIFPHHENEIAQSEGASGEPFAKYWIHHGFVTIKDEKMSKSLGNFLTIREVLEQFDPEALRLFVFSTHYRTPLDYSVASLQEAAGGIDRLYGCLAALHALPASGSDSAKAVASPKEMQKVQTLADRFHKAMDNDFNTAQGLGHIFDAVKALNRISQNLPETPAISDLAVLRLGADTIKTLTASMGLLTEDPTLYIEAKQKKILAELDINASDIDKLIAERNAARNDKNWARADEIRDLLLARRIELKDGPTGTTWHVKLA
ncbi:MAG TPA: cysteine--tRNA ligase [Deltaproteobacteria bacterium]|nr:cysteine--tRNA ligase [Deltaproteobacteria bacterium]